MILEPRDSLERIIIDDVHFNELGNVLVESTDDGEWLKAKVTVLKAAPKKKSPAPPHKAVTKNPGNFHSVAGVFSSWNSDHGTAKLKDKIENFTLEVGDGFCVLPICDCIR